MVRIAPHSGAPNVQSRASRWATHRPPPQEVRRGRKKPKQQRLLIFRPRTYRVPAFVRAAAWRTCRRLHYWPRKCTGARPPAFLAWPAQVGPVRGRHPCSSPSGQAVLRDMVLLDHPVVPRSETNRRAARPCTTNGPARSSRWLPYGPVLRKGCPGLRGVSFTVATCFTVFLCTRAGARFGQGE